MKWSKCDEVTNCVISSWVFSDNIMEYKFCSFLSFVCKYKCKCINICRYKMNTCNKIIWKLQKRWKNSTKNATSRFLNCYHFATFALLYSLHTYILLCFSEPFESKFQTWCLQCVFTNNRDVLEHNNSLAINIRNFDPIQLYNLEIKFSLSVL